MGCACSLSSGGASRARPQTSQAWLKHQVFQAWVKGEGRREKRKGRGGESVGEGQSGPLCLCVFLCAHVGGHTMCHLCA